jgi:hypothetical protein
MPPTCGSAPSGRGAPNGVYAIRTCMTQSSVSKNHYRRDADRQRARKPDFSFTDNPP